MLHDVNSTFIMAAGHEGCSIFSHCCLNFGTGLYSGSVGEEMSVELEVVVGDKNQNEAIANVSS